ncbi:hypothetical protein CDAR_514571 [Caerostris darwini]|uniref:Uncharacterized protein n=1 Tax=Caerostris darwini TaxID=1538125 RepID=A0AAV4NBN1_9ARAC|nr:hypothetical protein CDAR_514571 [Caerostris darwini]
MSPVKRASLPCDESKVGINRRWRFAFFQHTWHRTRHVRQWEAGKRNYDGTAQSCVAFQGWRRGGEGGADAPNGLIQISFALSFAGSALCSKKSR